MGEALTPLPLMQLSTAFWGSKTLFVAHELGVFARLSESGGATPSELAGGLSIDERPAEMLLTGCASLGLLEKRDGRYANSALAEEYLVPGRPSYFGGFVTLCDRRLYGTWGRLTEAIRTNRPVGWDPDEQRSFFDSEDADFLLGFYDAMHSLSTPTGRALAGVIDFARHSRLLDLGGGSGAIAIEVCRAFPSLRVSVFDLPHVVELAEGKIAAAGLSDRIETVAGDLFADEPYPDDHDVALLSLILHSFAEEQDRAILHKCHEALPSGGSVLVSELLVNDEKTGPAPAALMSLTMLVEDEGRNYTAAEYTDWLRDAGFEDVRRLPLDVPGANGLLLASKP
jgi:predicted O-methyltransferase YrrM